MLGGGTFTEQNKILPGAYINFVASNQASSALSGRGVVTMPLVLDWGPEGMFEVEQEDFLEDARKFFGYRAEDEKLAGLNDLFKHAKKLFAYRLNAGGAKAANAYATARYAGTRGNDLTIDITGNADGTFDVVSSLGGEKVDTQTVKTAAELEDNSFLVFNKSAKLEAVTSNALTGGTNGSATGDSVQAYLAAAESYSYNIMATATTDADTKKVYASFVKRMRETLGKKFQMVLYKYDGDYEGIINVANAVTTAGQDESSAVYWVAGAEAGCDIGTSVLNALYDGDLDISVENSQVDLRADITGGRFVFHNVNGNLRVLEDINSLVSTNATKSEAFKDNKTIRVIDQIANDIALLFTEKYLGKIQNDDDGRIAFWNDIVTHHNEMMKKRAIQNFSSSDVTVTQGKGKNDVVVSDAVEVTGTMAKLYMVVVVK